jgi:UDP-N-acetylmuramoyl-L-alanyl-D-glutamate--2,6-diaminopimelate ligase
MKLRDLLAKVPNICHQPAEAVLDREVTGLSTNSHACKPGDLFIGMPGTRVDGGTFWPSAIASGAVVAVITQEAAQKQPPETANDPVMSVTDMTQTCADLAAAFYGYPAKQLQMVGVTGTNGKTTTTHLIEYLLSQYPVALLGTLYTRWPGFSQVAVHTTPFSVELQEQLSAAVKAGAKFAVMEVSSHSLDQGRVLGCGFEVAVFTNLTQDHLDYHKTMEDYFEAKALLFSDRYLQGRAVINIDDDYGKRLCDRDSVAEQYRLPKEKYWTYSIEDSSADLWTADVTYSPSGVTGTLNTPVGNADFSLPLVGKYNVSNMLAAVGAALHLGLELSEIVAALPNFTGVPGRMEKVQITPDQDLTVIVDYAHTPDSLENVLKATRPFVSGDLICVFGCGGDRDRTKRPLMGGIAARLSDKAVVTSDNPRTEEPEKILEDILAGIDPETSPLVICDRAEAIRRAIMEAKPGDGIVIAGKGHEDYQILGTEKIHFDDREQARAALEEKFALVNK